MSRSTRWLDHKLYSAFPDQWDNILFRQHVLAECSADCELLDLGAGAGIVPQMNFKEHVGSAAGVDIDSRVMDNPFLDTARVAHVAELPWESESFDLVVSNNVLEHLAEPRDVFAEVARVLRPGGRFLCKTPNSRHYVALIARLTPHRFHEWFNRRRGRREADTFPTLYRCNTAARISALAVEVGLVVREVRLIEGRPEYLRFSLPSYLVGAGYERLVNLFGAAEFLRAVIVATLEKPES